MLNSVPTPTPANPTMTILSPINGKPGWKTSEFWMSLIAIGATMLYPFASHAVSTAPNGSWAATLGPALVAGLYSLSRSIAKKNAGTSTEDILSVANLLAQGPAPITPIAPSITTLVTSNSTSNPISNPDTY